MKKLLKWLKELFATNKYVVYKKLDTESLYSDTIYIKNSGDIYE